MTDSTGDALQRMRDALATAETFDRRQMAYVVSLAINLDRTTEAAYLAGLDEGYWQRVAEENREYPPPPYLITHGIKVRGDQAIARAAGDADRTQRWAGGSAADAEAAFMWEADRPEPVFDRAPLQVSWVRGVPMWGEN